MQCNDRHLPDAIHARVVPGTGRQIGNRANVEVVAECDFGRSSRQLQLTGKSEDDLIYEFGARQPVEVLDSA